MLDAVISADFYRPLAGASELRTQLAERLRRAPDYEAALNAARVWMPMRKWRSFIQTRAALSAAS